MKSKGVLVYGASGHGKVIIDIIEKEGEHEIVGVIDDDLKKEKVFCGHPLLGGFDLLDEEAYRNSNLILAIGDNTMRQKLYEKIVALGHKYEFISAVHPSAQIGKDVNIGTGTAVMANTAINSDTEIGTHVIINTGAVIEHDCKIGDYVHISPGACLAGGISVGDFSHVGIGASAIPGVKIGKNSIIGAGAVVVDDVPDSVTAIGIPAKIKKESGDF